MGFMSIALLAGAVLGLLTGGRPSNLRRHSVRAVGALGAAVVCQAVPRLLDVSGAAGLACVLASYALLVAFALANVRLMGMPVALVGLLLNVAVITVNGGMPVRAEAILSADRDRSAAEVAELDFGAKRHLERPSDRLTAIDDALPIRPLRQVVSFGDLILAAGIANVTFRLLRPRGAAAAHRREAVLGALAAPG